MATANAPAIDHDNYESTLSITSTLGQTQFLTFVLSNEQYGVNIIRVQEIKGWTPVTKIPNTPDFVCGVLNLRGTIVPIIDLRIRFNMENAEYTDTTVIIVLSVEQEDGKRVIGFVVDAVSDVLNVEANEVKPAPDLGSHVDMDFLSGLATIGDEMVMLLDIDKMMSTDDINLLETLKK